MWMRRDRCKSTISVGGTRYSEGETSVRDIHSIPGVKHLSKCPGYWSKYGMDSF